MAEWTTDELRAATRAYLWILRSAESGYAPNKAAVSRALINGPLATRTEGNIEYWFQNISAVLQNKGQKWIEGYKPTSDVGTNIAGEIATQIADYQSKQRHHQQVTFLAATLPVETVREAAAKLASGLPFNYAESTTYDAILSDGSNMAPKAVIGYAGQLHYGAPLLAEDFSGGEGTTAFAKLREAGLTVSAKAPPEAFPESPEFREKVRRRRKVGFDTPPVGKKNPKKVATTTTSYIRDSNVVAFVEGRAKGRCELCGQPSPFLRLDGTPYLEVHHIDPLSQQGSDTVENAVGLCPNCHRECHHGQNARELRATLRLKFEAT